MSLAGRPGRVPWAPDRSRAPAPLQRRLDRLETRVQELAFWLDRAHADLDAWTFDGEPLALGATWPQQDGVRRLAHPRAEVPADWPLDEVRVELALGGEALLRVAYEDADAEPFGLDAEHVHVPLRERAFTLEAEAEARLPFGVPNRQARLERARVVWVDRTLERLWRRLALVHEAAWVLTPDDVAEALVDAAERALRLVRWPSATPAYLGRVAQSPALQSIWALPPGLVEDPPGLDDAQRAAAGEACEALGAALDALRERWPQRGALAVSGHAHLDLAWLWPVEETRLKARRTFSTALALTGRYDELVFNQSSGQLYAWLEQDDPALLERVRAAAADGRWEPSGGMWVEPDCSMPSGESLARQLLYGQRELERHFGTTHDVCWLPDCFGFTAALPQLLRLAGIRSFFTIKLNWSESNRFPHDLFWWEGLDGSRVLAHTFDNPVGGYNGELGAASTVLTWRAFRARAREPESLMTFGFGDGGGGVTEEMLERARDLARLPAVPALHHGPARDLFDRLHERAQGGELPVWVGELYLELHRGTLTTQGRLKRLHRRAERDLVAAEAVAGLRALAGGPHPGSLDEGWKRLLLTEFHDVLPGSSIGEVYREAEERLEEVVRDAGEAADRDVEALAGELGSPGGEPALLVVNPDLSARPLRAHVTGELPGAQAVEGGSVVSGTARVEGLSAAVVLDLAPAAGLEVAPDRLENAFVRVTLDRDGTLLGVLDKRAGREALADRGNQLWAYVDRPRVWDAWDVDEGIRDAGAELELREAAHVVEEGPHRVAVRVVRGVGDSTVTQTLRLWAGSPRLDLHTRLDWHDRRIMLKARFPLAVRAQAATFETAFGVVQRATHRNTSWDAARFEVAGHRFADLSEPGFGVALLNDGKYGHEALGSELALSLVRSPVFPDPLADEGVQEFTYALLPHQGDWLEGGVLAEAEDLNRPLLARAVRAAEARELRPLRVGGLPLGLGALKAHEDGDDLVLRVFEPQGARGSADLALPPGWALAEELDLLERPAGEAQLALGPFQVRTWRLART